MNNVCVYFHVNPIKQEIFYVGIGDNKIRPYRRNCRTKYWKNIVRKYGYQVIIIHDNITYEEASKLEIKYIAQIGRHDKKLGPLANLTNGGDGIRGFKNNNFIKSRTHRLKITEYKLNNKRITLKNAQSKMMELIKDIS